MLGKHIYNISHCPKIEAVAYVFSPLENTLYYATDSEVYAVMLATENRMTELRYPTSAGNPLATGENYFWKFIKEMDMRLWANVPGKSRKGSGRFGIPSVADDNV
ncbi:MAG: hypothetical protein ACLU30_12090 [Odoribacter splanchnicus]